MNTPITIRNERKQVQVAVQPRIAGPALSALFADQGIAPASACRVLDMKYEPGQYCRILYQIGGQMLIGSFRWGEDESTLPETSRLVEAFGMQAYLFQHDPALPGLATALDPVGLAHALQAVLPECAIGQARIVQARATPLRYRPGRRCTLRLDLWLRDSARNRPERRTFFGKIYHDLAKAESVYRDMHMLADSPAAREGRVALARPVAFLPDLRLMIQEPLAGVALELLLEGMRGNVTAGDRRGWDGVVESASALAAIHTAGLMAGRERSIDNELRRFMKRADQAAAIDPVVGGMLGKLAAALPPWRARMAEWGEQITLVHGDCKHSQCLLDGNIIGVLDFDHCGMADPANDIGMYLATLRQLAIHQRILAHDSRAALQRAHWLRTLESAFLEAYCSASGYAPEFRLRATWYQAVALMRKALRAFARSPHSPMPAAEVAEAWKCLSDLPR